MERIVIYQVLPRLFGNISRCRKVNGSIQENGCGKLNDFTVAALKSIKELGATHIWYTGVLEHATQTDYTPYGIEKDYAAIVKGKAGSPYAIKDYYDIDPDLACDVNRRKDEFDALIVRTHKAGLKVIIDFVPNHLARRYHSDAAPKGVMDFGEHDMTGRAFDPNNNYYYIPDTDFNPTFPLDGYEEFPAKATGNDCFRPNPSVNDWYETVKLNYGVDYMNGHRSYFHPRPDTWHKMLHILLYWAGKGVDGFRCDMAEMVPVEFWQWAIAEVKCHYPQVLFIAEVYKPILYREYIYRGGFDYLYDKVGMYDTLRSVTQGEQWASDITHCWQDIDDIRGKMLNFMENHDEQRIASEFFAGNGERGRAAVLVSALQSKSPFMVYFGQELGERGMDAEGFSGRDGRTTIFDYWSLSVIQQWQHEGAWDETLLSHETKALRGYYKHILRLSNSELAFKEGQFYDLMWLNYNNTNFNCRYQYAFIRHHHKEVILCIANFSAENSEIGVIIGEHCLNHIGLPINSPCHWVDLLSGKRYSYKFDPIQPLIFTVEAHSGAILKYSVN